MFKLRQWHRCDVFIAKFMFQTFFTASIVDFEQVFLIVNNHIWSKY